ncbi:MAG TPA: hypothetical protein VMR06_02515 [Dokdonella sp.]|uniref:hypothetical protein n=1 Tax=Dokdonella sp. TaxID=2291710 RepID=UPI002C70ABB3|nr:hypothetical protein [Dokdonella sp.]HUD40850.1 hypothetical protein [Dokdonella sp.]
MSQLHRIRGCDNPNREMDVVFIHGLGGDAFGTWRHGGDESTSWPHWLGADTPNVGVWSLGYAAAPSKWPRIFGWFGLTSRDAGYAMSLPDRARQVVDLMIQKGLGQRPLILVGHSLGGLLTKQLLRYSVGADQESGHQMIAQATSAVLFLGTPHTGAALASIADRFRTVFGATVTIEALRKHDPYLRDLFDWYRNNAPRLRIETATYYELRGVAGGTITIVDPSSAHPSVGRNPVGLDEDHLTLAKPRERDAQVCAALRRLISNTQSSSRPKPTPVASQSSPSHTIVVQVKTPSDTPSLTPRVPRELPPRAEHYFGRQAEREKLISRVRGRRNTTIVGPGGLGKTALAAEVLYAIGSAELESLYPDGTVYLDLYASRANADAIWSMLANRLTGADFLEHEPPRIRAERACSGKRLLLIFEGCEEADGNDGRADLTDLLSVIPIESVRLLLTRPPGRAAPAESIHLRDALEPADAAALLGALSGDRLTVGAKRDLLVLLAGHPLALTWAGNLLARDDEHPDTLLRDWSAAVLPPLTDPVNSTRTLRWLYDRSIRGFDADAKNILIGAGLLAHAPIPIGLLEIAINGGERHSRARRSLRALTAGGLMRFEIALPDHWQFAHVLAYRYARDHATDADALALALAEGLHASIATDCVRANESEARARLLRSLDHVAALLRAGPLTQEAGWHSIANTLLYDWQAEFMARGRSDLVRQSLHAVEAWVEHPFAAQAEHLPLLRENGVLHNRWGDLLVLQGDLPGAQTRYDLGLAISQRLAELDPGHTEWQRDLSISFIKLGDVQSAQGDLPGAQARYEAGLGIAQRLAELGPGHTEWQRDLSISFNKLGDVQSARGDLPGAQVRYEAGLVIAQRLAELDPANTLWQRDLSISFDKLGDVQSALGDLTGAQVRYEAGLVIAQRLAELDPGNTQWQRDLNISFIKLGDVQSAQGDLPGAQVRYEAGLVIAQRLAELDPANTQWQRDLSISFDKLGDVQAARGDLPGAQVRYEAGLVIAQRLAELDPANTQWQRDLGISFNKLGDAQSAQGDLPAAQVRSEAGLVIAQRLAELDPANTRWQRDLSISFNKLGDVQSAQGDLPGAQVRYEAALTIRQRLAELDPGNTQWQRDLSISFNKLGDVQSARGDLPGAQVRYEAGLVIAQRLTELDPANTRWQRDLSISFDKLGDVESAQGDLPGAQMRYEAALTIRQQLAELYPGSAQ